jgi:ZIP family zinc transporter
MPDNPHTFMWVVIFATLSALVNAAGILAIVRYRVWAEKAKTYFMCFAAGVLISTPLMLAFLGGVALAVFIVMSKFA